MLRPSDPGSHSRARQTNPPSERKGCARVAQKARGTPDRPLAPCKRLGGSSCNLTETQRPRLALEGARQTNPSFRAKRMREGRIKSQGTPDRPLALCKRLEGSSCNHAETQRPRLALEGGSANKPLLLNEKDARGSHKKPGELLIALSLRAEARGLFLHPERKTSNPSSHSEARKNAMKRAPSPLRSRGSKAGPPKGFDSRPRTTESGTAMGEPVHGQGPRKRSLRMP